MAELSGSGAARRIPISVQEPAIGNLETFMEELRAQPEAWEWVLREMNVSALTGGGTLVAVPIHAPNSLPQVLGVAAAVGLRAIRERLIDAQFEHAAAEFDTAVPPNRVRAVHARSRAAIESTIAAANPA